MKHYYNTNADTPYTIGVFDISEITVEWLRGIPCKAFGVGKGQNAFKYLSLYMGFDIETYTSPETHCGYMYIWQLSLNSCVIIGRTWEQIVELLTMLRVAFGLNEKRRVLIWDANLSFEFQFFRHWVNVTHLFAKEKREPLYCTIDGCIDFRDCLPISGGSLEQLAKMYTNTKKCTGDLDYSIPRNKFTELSETELSYCYNDVIILAEWSKYIFGEYIIPKHYCPLTSTQILCKEMKARAVEQIGKTSTFKNIISSCFPRSEKEYNFLMNWCFRGGYVHGNINYTGFDFNDIYEYEHGLPKKYDIQSVDFTSSYPSVIFTRYGCLNMQLARMDKAKYLREINTKCVIAKIRFFDVRNKTHHSIESRHKCIELANPIIDNGRVLCADMMTVVYTELDFRVFEMFYDYSDFEICFAWVGSRVEYPRYLIENLAGYYSTKQRKKRANEPYNIEKARANAHYGACVKRLCENDITYDNDEWGMYHDEDGYAKQVENAVLPMWLGIYITAWARYNLLSIVAKIGNDVLYCDTDSIKCLNYTKHKHIIEEYNREQEDKNRAFCEKYGFDFEDYYDIGCFEEEYNGGVLRLKYLGAKRYIRDYIKKDKETGEVKRVTECTIAGLPKKRLLKEEDIYDIFNNNMKLDNSGKLASHYEDEPHEEVIAGVLCKERSSVGLYEVSFEMKLDEKWLMLICQSLNKLYERGLRL